MGIKEDKHCLQIFFFIQLPGNEIIWNKNGLLRHPTSPSEQKIIKTVVQNKKINFIQEANNDNNHNLHSDFQQEKVISK